MGVDLGLEATDAAAEGGENPRDWDVAILDACHRVRKAVDVVGEGDASTSVKEYSPFTLTFNDPFPADTHDGEIRILYGTKKKSENRIDFIYTDTDGIQKKLIIWDGVYDGSTLILDGCPALIGVVDQPEYTDYTPASAMVEFSYEPPPED